MTDDDKKLIEDTIIQVIKTTVNGKIDRIDKKLDAHMQQHIADMEELRPYIQAKGSIGILYKGVLGAGGLALAWGAIKSFFPNL